MGYGVDAHDSATEFSQTNIGESDAAECRLYCLFTEVVQTFTIAHSTAKSGLYVVSEELPLNFSEQQRAQKLAHMQAPQPGVITVDSEFHSVETACTDITAIVRIQVIWRLRNRSLVKHTSSSPSSKVSTI